jgi:beta-glucosidase
VRNVGGRRGKEVVQIYTSRPDSSLDRPARVLSGFAVVVADPGETIDVEIPIEERTLRHWVATSGSWVVEPGRLRIEAGSSAGNLPLVDTATIA